MASIYANKTYNSFVVEVSFINKRWRFWGFPRRSDAEKFGKQMEDLKTYHKHGLERPTPLVVWLDNLWKNNPEKYNLIVEMGLAEFREQCGTVGELIERFVPYAINGQEPKKRTSIGRRGACNVLLNFLARQKAGNFRRDARALKLASNIPAKEITPEIAEKFYSYIKKSYQPSTWGRRIKHLKTMFGLAVSFGWITRNPFEKFRGTAQTNRERRFDIDPELAKRVLNACPNTRLKLAFAFARWGGLRMPSEISYMRWEDILWDEHRIKICVPKKTCKIDEENGNFKTRCIPIFPEIRVELEAYRAELLKTGENTEGTAFIFPGMAGNESAGTLLRKQFHDALKRAGIEEWPKFFTNLRATRDSELQKIYPIHLVCEWIGHTAKTSLQHYTHATQKDFKEASTRTEENTEE